MRSSIRKRTRNQSIKSRIRTLEKSFTTTVAAGEKEASQAAYRTVCSALDKAAKSGVIHWAKADRKKSRLAARI